MSKHTPGPWIIEAENPNDVVSDIYDVEICNIQPVDLGGPKNFNYGAQTAANVNLIAASPALFDALENLRSAFVIAAGDRSPFAKMALRETDAAIALAKGESA